MVCKVFEEWKQNRVVESCTLKQTLDMAITDMSACSLNYWLSKFVQEVSNSSGECYPSLRCTQSFAD